MLRRYNVTLTKETVDEFQALTKVMKFPQNIMSQICDEAISKTLQTFKHFREKGNLTLTDLFTMIGEETQKMMDEDKNSVQVGKETSVKKAKSETIHKTRRKAL